MKSIQKEYSHSFKLRLVKETSKDLLTKSRTKLKYGIQGDSTVTKWLQKYGAFDWGNLCVVTITKTTEQRIMELEAKVKLLEKQEFYIAKNIKDNDLKRINCKCN